MFCLCCTSRDVSPASHTEVVEPTPSSPVAHAHINIDDQTLPAGGVFLGVRDRSAPEETPAGSLEPEPAVEKGPREWKVTLTKPPGLDSVGMKVQCISPVAITVKRLREGSLITDWNSLNPDKQVTVGDAIVSVNGATDASSILTKLKEESSLSIVVKHVPEFVILVEKDSSGLGLLLVSTNSGAARVADVAKGKAVSAYNADAEAGKAVMPGFFLVSVNGKVGGKEELLDAMVEASGTVELKFLHPSVQEGTG